MRKRMGSILLCITIILCFVSCSTRTTESIENENTNKIALYNCSIIDGNGNFIEKDGIVLIKGDKIESVGTAEEEKLPKDYKAIDLNQHTVLPGLINSHVHSGYKEGQLKNWLQAGVTTVRDLSYFYGGAEVAIAERDENNLRFDTARVITAPKMLTVQRGYGDDYFSSVEEAKAMVNDEIEMGADLIKISICDYQAQTQYTLPTEEELRALVDTAHAGGKKVSVHISQEKHLESAVEIGVDDIAHMVIEPIDQDICDTLVKKNIYWIPTLELWSGVSDWYQNNYREIAVNNLKLFYEAGGKIALGTDFGGYFTKFDQGFPITEIRLMSAATMSNMDIILAATKNAAYVCDREEELGTIEAGKIADLLIVDGHPLDQIEDLQNTNMVIHNGQIAFEK